MGDLGGILSGSHDGAVLVQAIVSKAPADATEEVEVTIESFDGGVRAWSCPFMPRAASGDPELPAVDDVCLVAFDETRSPWVVMWTPA